MGNGTESNSTFVIGWPIAHSRSPLIHNHWLAEHGIDGRYERQPVEPENLPAFIDGLRQGEWRGGNVTMPHKEAALTLADEVTSLAKTLGAANTLWVEDGRVHADNTDGFGFTANLDAEMPGWDEVDHALVLGAGGAARAIVYALAERGIPRITVANRTLARAEAMIADLGIEAEATTPDRVEAFDTGLLVNTTSIGMEGEGLAFDVSDLPEDALVTDIVYTPLETPLLAAARSRGLKAVDGLGMLLHQARSGFARWYDVKPDVTPELRAKIVADLGDAA